MRLGPDDWPRDEEDAAERSKGASGSGGEERGGVEGVEVEGLAAQLH